MSERDELARIIRSEYTRAIDRKRVADCFDAPADAVLAAGYRKPRTITTTEELDALPVGSVVLDSEDNSAQKDEDGYWHYWGGDSGWGKTIRKFPATVIHEPKADQ